MASFLDNGQVTPRGSECYWRTPTPAEKEMTEVELAEKDMLFVRPSQIGIRQGKLSVKRGLVIDVVPDAYLEEFEKLEENNEIYMWQERDLSLSYEATLNSLPMFRDEMPQCEAVLHAYGHRLQMSPRYHCECAGEGIEFDNGRSKWYFRKCNDFSTDGFKRAAATSMSKSNLPRALSAKYERRCRDYVRCYRLGCETNGLEKMRKEIKSHRNMFDSYRAYVSSNDLDDDEAQLAIHNHNFNEAVSIPDID